MTFSVSQASLIDRHVLIVKGEDFIADDIAQVLEQAGAAVTGGSSSGWVADLTPDASSFCFKTSFHAEPVPNFAPDAMRIVSSRAPSPAAWILRGSPSAPPG